MSHPHTTYHLARPGAPPNHVPTRLSLSNYMRYERFIKDYMAAWPTPVDFVPDEINVETFSKGFRNAVRSVLCYNWPAADIDIERLREIYPATVVATNPTCVRVGPRTGPRAPEASRLAPATSFDLDTTDTLAIKAAIVLLARGKLSAPVLLRGDPQPALDYIEQNSYDVSLMPAPDAGGECYTMF